MVAQGALAVAVAACCNQLLIVVVALAALQLTTKVGDTVSTGVGTAFTNTVTV